MCPDPGYISVPVNERAEVNEQKGRDQPMTRIALPMGGLNATMQDKDKSHVDNAHAKDIGRQPKAIHRSDIQGAEIEQQSERQAPENERESAHRPNDCGRRLVVQAS